MCVVSCLFQFASPVVLLVPTPVGVVSPSNARFGACVLSVSCRFAFVPKLNKQSVESLPRPGEAQGARVYMLGVGDSLPRPDQRHATPSDGNDKSRLSNFSVSVQRNDFVKHQRARWLFLARAVH